MSRGCARIVFVAALIGVPAGTSGQTAAGSIAGVVRDATGAVLPNVMVEAASPALIEKVRVAQTDTDGRYQIIELRPGIYSVTFILDGFATVRREGIELNTGFTATVNADMKVGSVAETITVAGETPVVDLQNTHQQVNLTRDVIDGVPSGRSFQNLGILIPGVSGGQVVGSPVNQDVGGSSGQSFMTLAIHGGRMQDQRIDLDGMSTSAWTRPDSSAIVFTDGNIQEYNITLAANSADIETGGVRINVIPREGGNAFRGGFFGNYASPDLQAENNTSELRARGLLDANRLKANWSVNPTFGGPIAPDKLWFFGTYTYSRTDTLVGDSYLNSDPAAWDFVPDSTQQAVDDQYSKDYSTRITWQATERNKFASYLSYNNTCHCHFLVGRANSPIPVNSDASVLLHIPNKVFQGTWSSPVTNRLLAEAGVSYIIEDQQFNARPEAVAPTITDQARNVIYRATPSSMRAYTTVYGSRGSLSYVTGTHAVKVGYSLTMGEYEQTASRVGNMSFTATNGVPNTVTYLGTPILALNRIRPNLGLYAQDQWTVNRFTLNAGLRLDTFRSDFPDQNVAPTQFVPAARFVEGQEVVNWKDLNPRLGLAYDLFGDGRTALKVSANRYVLGEGTGRASAINPIQSNNSMTRQWIDANNDRVIQGDPLNPNPNGELLASQQPLFGRPSNSLRYDREWSHGFQNRPYNWEFSGGVQHELLPRMSVNAAYFRRVYGNFTVTDATAAALSDFSSYCVTGPADARLPGGGSERICGLRDVNSATLLAVDRLTTFASNYGNQFERWNGVDLTVNARLPQLLLQGGVSTGRTYENDCAVVRNVPEAVPAARAAANSERFCETKSPFLTQVKLLGAYTLPYEIQLSGAFQSSAGPEITAIGTFVNAQISPSLGRNLSTGQSASIGLLEPRSEYGERLYQLDLRFAKGFSLNRTRFQATLDLYNALNGNTVLVQNNQYGVTTSASTAWQRPQAILPARIVKVGVQLNF